LRTEISRERIREPGDIRGSGNLVSEVPVGDFQRLPPLSLSRAHRSAYTGDGGPSMGRLDNRSGAFGVWRLGWEPGGVDPSCVSSVSDLACISDTFTRVCLVVRGINHAFLAVYESRRGMYILVGTHLLHRGTVAKIFEAENRFLYVSKYIVSHTLRQYVKS